MSETSLDFALTHGDALAPVLARLDGRLSAIESQLDKVAGFVDELDRTLTAVRSSKSPIAALATLRRQ